MTTDRIAAIRAAADEIARKDLEARLDVVSELAADEAAEEQLQEELRETQQRRARNWAKALKLGWAPQELRKAGLSDPERRAVGRPAGSGPRRGRRSPSVAPEAANNAAAAAAVPSPSAPGGTYADTGTDRQTGGVPVAD